MKRNVVGAMNALSSADMALAGIESRIPPDQVIDAMKEVGDQMNSSLKETAWWPCRHAFRQRSGGKFPG